MKIAYVANVRMPTEKAHGLQIMHMCRAFTLGGHDVTLIVPKRKNWIEKSIWEFYDAEPIFKIVEVPIIDFIVWDKWLGNFALWFETIWFGMNGRRVIEELAPDVVYSRDPFSSAWTPRWIPHVFEAHTFPNRALRLHRWLWRKCDRIVTVTDGLKRMFVAQGVPEDRLRTAADAVDLDAFAVEGTKQDARKKLNLPSDAFLVVYAGHLYPYKGIPDLIEACQWLDPSIRVVIVGGRQEDLSRTKEAAAKFGLKNVLFIGRVPHKEVPLYLHAADLAVMPYTRESHHVEYYSSPLKLFEYLAAGRAIISTDLPSVREVLDDETADFVPPENPHALADGINRLRKNPARLAALEAHSTRISKMYTWKNRAVAVLDAVPKPRIEWTVTIWKKYRDEISLALVALVIRLAYVTLVPQYPLAGGDGAFYTDLADHILGRGEWFQNWPVFFQPGYPLLLVAVRGIFGPDLIWGRVVQAFFGAGTVFVMALMARRWVSPYAARVAGILGALYVPAILETGIYYTETVYTFFLTLAVYLFIRLWEVRTVRAALLAGAAFAASGFVRELGFWLAFLVGAGFAVWKRAPKLAALFLVPVVITLGGIALRNQAVAKNIDPSAHVNVPLVGKGYESTLAESGFWQAALDPSRAHLYPEGIWRFFRFPFRLTDLTADDVSAKQVLLSGDRTLLAAHWPQITGKIVVVGIHWLILMLAVAGTLRGKLSREAKAAILLAIGFAAGTIILNGVGRVQCDFRCYEPLARYRFPVDPLIIVLAAAGLEWWSRRRGDVKAQ